MKALSINFNKDNVVSFVKENEKDSYGPTKKIKISLVTLTGLRQKKQGEDRMINNQVLDMRFVFVLVFAAVFSLSLFSNFRNIDKPLKGNWNLKLEKVWEISGTGEELFAEISQVMVDEDGTLYVLDRKLNRFYIFSKEGDFKNAFGCKGEGPGEFKNIYHSKGFLVNDKFIADDIDRINYFSKDGKFIRTVKNNRALRKPVIFISEDEFIFSPILKDAPGLEDSTAKITRFNLKSGKETHIAEFSIYEGGVHESDEGLITVEKIGVTPMMTICYDKNSTKLYYGMNDNYVINVATLSGKVLNSFSLKREKKKLTKKFKKSILKSAAKILPKDTIDKLIKGLPDYETYFTHIEVNNGLTYVYVPDWDCHNSKQVDIFSPDGKYLYRTYIKVSEDLFIKISHYKNTIFKNGYLHLVVEDENDEIKIIKYRVNLPSHN